MFPATTTATPGLAIYCCFYLLVVLLPPPVLSFIPSPFSATREHSIIIISSSSSTRLGAHSSSSSSRLEGGSPMVTTADATAVTAEVETKTEEEKIFKDLTLVFCRRRRKRRRRPRGPSHDAPEEGDDRGDGDDGSCDEMLLGMKKRGFGVGKWNGFGGKVESGETVEQAAKRELVEESGVTAGELSLRGRLIFHVPSYPSVMRVHVYEAVSYEGDPAESEEMRPRWFRVAELPLKEMWADDEYWMPLFLEGKCFRGEFHFSDDQTITSHDLEEVTPEGVLL